MSVEELEGEGGKWVRPGASRQGLERLTARVPLPIVADDQSEMNLSH